MPNGALIFAQRSVIDYVAVARVSAQLVQRHLGLPVCLVTSHAVSDPAFDQVIVVDPPTTKNQRYYVVNGQKTLGPWFNESRANALDLTPWDRTLLIDADYFVLSNQLKSLVESDIDFACYTQAKDLVSQQSVDSTAGHRPLSWATVCWFNKHSRPVFEMWKRIRDNWNFYNQLCDFNQPVFRNDHAMTLALDTISGHIPHYQSIPGRMTNLLPGTQLLDIQPDSTIKFATGKGVSKIKNTDIHVIDKSICTSDQWLKKLESVHA